MKCVILAGGMGTRISEESHLKPKPMIEIGGRPIIWHIMKIYGAHGITEFVICCGHKGYLIKEYFSNYFLHMSDVTIDMANNSMEVHHKTVDPWKVTLIDTGEHTMTGGRIKRAKDFVDDTFCLTYGDGVSDVNINELIKFHKDEGAMVTVTATQPSGRFGALEISGSKVKNFEEKRKGDGRWINGGFFVCQPNVFDRIEGDATLWEKEPLETLALEGNLSVYKHDGFWAAMDSMKDKAYLESLWSEGSPPWKVWS
jgi:glucose-1-phosphate cytidylyltransferase